MTYEEQLATTEWHIKRQNIIARDGHKCQFCGRSEGVEISFRDANGKFYRKYYVYEFDDAIRIRHIFEGTSAPLKIIQREYGIYALTATI